MDWARILAYVTGTVDQELLARNEYLVTENRILKAQLKGRLKLSDAERAAVRDLRPYRGFSRRHRGLHRRNACPSSRGAEAIRCSAYSLRYASQWSTAMS